MVTLKFAPALSASFSSLPSPPWHQHLMHKIYGQHKGKKILWRGRGKTGSRKPGTGVVTWALKEEEDGQAFPVGGAAYRHRGRGMECGRLEEGSGPGMLAEQVWAGVRGGWRLGNEVTKGARDQLGLTSICRQWWDRGGNTQSKSLFLECCDMVWSVGEKGRRPVRGGGGCCAGHTRGDRTGWHRHQRAGAERKDVSYI